MDCFNFKCSFTYVVMILLILLLIANVSACDIKNVFNMFKFNKNQTTADNVVADKNQTTADNVVPGSEIEGTVGLAGAESASDAVGDAVDESKTETLVKSRYDSIGQIDSFDNKAQFMVASNNFEDYSMETQRMALEPSIFESQKRWMEDRNRITTGASAVGARDDRNDINPFQGLRRPNYGGSTGCNVVGKDARVVPSEVDCSQLPADSNTNWTF